MKRTPPKRRRPVPLETLLQIQHLCDGRCVVCKTPCDARRDRHHLLPVREWPEYELVATNQVLCCIGCHMNHENAARRITLAELPESHAYWLYERACASGGVEAFVDRTYPPVAAPATTERTTTQEVQHGRRDPLW
jgi:hypothetical protein